MSDVSYGDGLLDAAKDIAVETVRAAFRHLGSREDAKKLHEAIEKELAEQYRHYNKAFL